MRKPGRSAAAIAAVPIALLVGVVIAAQFPGAAAGTPAAVVASAHDGDTLTLTNGQRVRLLQIDTPELGSGECYSRAARTALVQRVPILSSVRLEVDPRLDRVDRYGDSSGTSIEER
jgi:endonuclease YncB( thermonuclease family)